MKFEIIPTKAILYDKCENVEQLYDNFYYPLLVEYKELKKQLEENKHKGLYNTCLPYSTGYNKAIKDKENQQKEFISYLEDEINKLKEQIKNYDLWHEVGTDINFLILKKQFYLTILQKYKEIIGDVKNEK